MSGGEPVALILAPDRVELYDPGPRDAYGWQDPPAEPPRARWCGEGNLQLAGGLSNPRGDAGGGYGPHNPARSPSGVLYLPPEACPVEGASARVRGRWWVLSQVRDITDPGGTGLGCYMATVTGTEGWGSDGG